MQLRMRYIYHRPLYVDISIPAHQDRNTWVGPLNVRSGHVHKALAFQNRRAQVFTKRIFFKKGIELPCLLLFFVIAKAQCLSDKYRSIDRLCPMGSGAAGRRLFEEYILLKGDF